MAVKSRSKSKRIQIPEDDDGNPDIYVLMDENEMTLDEAAEAAGIGRLKAWRFLLKQEVEHNPETRVSPRIKKDRKKLAAWVVKMRDEEKLRWERLIARSGLTKAELMELYEEATGEEPRRLRGGLGADDEEEEVEAKPKRGSAKKGAKATKAVEEDDDDEDDDEDEDEDDEPVAKSKSRRGRTRR